ncbi:MAG: hypothetical protein ACOYEB_07405 [Enterococcus lemanii]|jgi:hypothetical protein
MKNKATIIVHSNCMLRLPEVPGLFVLSKYNVQYQQYKKIVLKDIDKKKQKEEKNEKTMG